MYCADVATDYNAHNCDNNRAQSEQVHGRMQILPPCCYHPLQTCYDLETNLGFVLFFRIKEYIAEEINKCILHLNVNYNLINISKYNLPYRSSWL